MDKIETAYQLVTLLALRSQLTESLIKLRQGLSLCNNINDIQGKKDFSKIIKTTEKLREKYRKAMPNEHIKDVEIMKKHTHFSDLLKY